MAIRRGTQGFGLALVIVAVGACGGPQGTCPATPAAVAAASATPAAQPAAAVDPTGAKPATAEPAKAAAHCESKPGATSMAKR